MDVRRANCSNATKTMNVKPGDAVLTKFGAGVVVRCFGVDAATTAVGNGDEDDDAPTPAWASVRLWRQPGRSVASCALATLRVEDCVVRKIAAAPGVIVRASRQGVVAAASAADGDGRGDGAATPAEGAEEEGSREKTYLIETYLPSKGIFLASSIDDDRGGNGSGHSGHNNHSLARSLAIRSMSEPSSNDDQKKNNNTSESRKTYYELEPCQISSSSTSAKFYPVLEDLMRKGEAAWIAAAEKCEKSPSLEENMSSVSNAVSSAVTITTADGNAGGADDVAKMLSDTSKSSIEALNEKLGDVTLENADHATANFTVKQTLDTAADRAKTVSAAATEGLSFPQTEEIRQVYDMLRDEDLTKLFRMGKERLKELVEVEIPTRTRKALGAMGIELDDDEDAEQFVDTVENGKQTLRGGMGRLRRDALASLDQILKMDAEDGHIVVQAGDGGGAIQINTKNIIDPSLLPATNISATDFKQMAQIHFASAFDRLSRAAASDPQLSGIFFSISERSK